jgi:hypothetical protein
VMMDPCSSFLHLVVRVVRSLVSGDGPKPHLMPPTATATATATGTATPAAAASGGVGASVQRLRLALQ